MPKIQVGASVEQLQNNLFATPNNYEAGFELYQRQLEEGRTNDGLITIRRFTEKPGAPAYFHFLEAEAWAAQENWERAWMAWQAFESARSDTLSR